LFCLRSCGRSRRRRRRISSKRMSADVRRRRSRERHRYRDRERERESERAAEIFRGGVIKKGRWRGGRGGERIRMCEQFKEPASESVWSECREREREERSQGCGGGLRCG
jgi:hypothetical protein